ncbi:hypothetical protein MMC26_004978 [Xylographa opegraphella]|nr:hypothetical protein [Xylographa opegraphella]
MSNSFQAMDENTLINEFTPPRNFVHSSKNAQISYTPEELQLIASIVQDSNIDDPHKLFAPTLDSVHSDNDRLASEDESYMSSASHTVASELDLSTGDFYYDENTFQTFNNGLPHDGSVTSPAMPENGSNLAFLDSSSFSHSPSDLQHSHSDPRTCRSSTSNLCAAYKELESCGSVPPDLDNNFESRTSVSPSEFFHSEQDLQASKGESTSSMVPPTLCFGLCTSSTQVQGHGGPPLILKNGIQSNASGLGCDSPQISAGSRSFKPESSSSAFTREDQIFRSERSASPLKTSYSGHGFQLRNDDFCIFGLVRQGQSLSRQANDVDPNSLTSGDEWQTINNVTAAPTSIAQYHLHGHPMHLIFKGNDFRSLVRVIEAWPSASFLDIGAKDVISTAPKLCIDLQAIPAVMYGVVIPSPWTNSRLESLRPASQSPLPPDLASIWRKDYGGIRAYSIMTCFDDHWAPHIEYEGADMLPKRMIIGSSLGVSLVLDESLSAGVFRYEDPNSSDFPPETFYEETFVMAGISLYGVDPRAEISIT